MFKNVLDPWKEKLSKKIPSKNLNGKIILQIIEELHPGDAHYGILHREPGKRAPVRYLTPVLQRNYSACQAAEPHESLMRAIERDWMWATCPHNEGREQLASSLWSRRAAFYPRAALQDFLWFCRLTWNYTFGHESPAGSGWGLLETWKRKKKGGGGEWQSVGC